MWKFVAEDKPDEYDCAWRQFPAAVSKAEGRRALVSFEVSLRLSYVGWYGDASRVVKYQYSERDTVEWR